MTHLERDIQVIHVKRKARDIIIGLATIPTLIINSKNISPPTVLASDLPCVSPVEALVDFMNKFDPHFTPPLAEIQTQSGERYFDVKRHPDFNLGVRGYEKDDSAPKTLRRSEDGYIDPHVPDLTTLQRNGAFTIMDVYRIYSWDWKAGKKGQPLNPGTLVGIETQVNELIQAPSIGYKIGGPYKYMVIYADEDEITINATLNGDAVSGYTIHLKGFQVDSSILELYRKLNNAGRYYLPALGPLARLGCATSNRLLISIRDTGTFMDARDLNDWGFDQSKLSSDNRP